MPIQLLLNLMIAFLWVLLNDNWDNLSFFVGYLLGLGIIFVMRRFFPTPFYLRKIISILKLTYVFFRELVTSSIFVMKKIISPRLTIKPGIFALKTSLTGNWQITALAMLLTLTPGSVIMEVFPDEGLLYIHAMDIPENKAKIIKATQAFEKAIVEVAG